MQFYPLSIKKIINETPDCISVEFNIPDNLVDDFQYKQGQYLTFKHTINNQELRRSYSLCSSPFEKKWKVAIKKVEGGRFSTFANEELKEGGILETMPPQGNFFTEISPKNNKKYVLFAAGSGITPIISILKEILHSEPLSEVVLVYGNKNFDSIIFREEIIGLKNSFISRLQVINVLSREISSNPLFTGRIDTEKCQNLSKAFFNINEVDEFFICGPEAMILEVSNFLKEAKIDKQKIHFELFTTPTQNLGGKTTDHRKSQLKTDQKSQIAIIIDGNQFDLKLSGEGETILDAALNNGADLPFACKGGVCCTCKAKVLEGEVKMDVNYSLEEDEVADGFVLTCQSHPLTERVVVDFDY